MDANQFKEFLSAFQSQNTLLSHLIAQISVKSENPSINVSPFECYNSKEEKFSCYLERFQNYCQLKNFTDKTKLAQLLCASIGSSHYNSLAAFLGPDKPINTLTYDELITVLKKLLIPRKSVILSQHYFLSKYQKENQTIAEYVADLQRDLAECEFSLPCTKCKGILSIAEPFLRAQFIRGLRDDWLKEQILQSNVSSFDEILAKAVSLEASKIESKQLTRSSQPLQSNFSTTDINKTSSKFQSPSYGNRDNSYSRHQNRPSPGVSNRQNNYRKPDYRALGIENLCVRCGNTNHKVIQCYIDRYKLELVVFIH